MTSVNVFAESYANRCLAEKLLDLLRNARSDVRFNLKHTPKMGRDEIVRRLREKVEGPAIVLIDFEHGRSRVFVERFFVDDKLGHSGVVIARHGNKIGVIFDPDVEDGFLSKFWELSQEDRTRIKNRRYAEKVINKILSKTRSSIEAEVQKIADCVLKLLNKVLA